MELMIFFKNEYNEVEREEHEKICDKMFSNTPYGIGSRRLTDLELITFQDVMSDVEVNGYGSMILGDLVLFHRTGNMDHVDEGGRFIVQELYKNYVRLIRLRLQDSVGLPYVIDALTGRKVDMTSVVYTEVEMAFAEVRRFNQDLVGEVLVKDGIINRKLMDKILDYVQKGVGNDLMMYAQSIYYYDMQSEFVFDDLEFRFLGQTFKWRQYLGGEKDDLFDHDNVTLILRYVDFEMICNLKYSSKKLYKFYLHLRRSKCFSKNLGSVRARGWEGSVVGNATGSVRFSGFKFWCDAHQEFRCIHTSLNNSRRHPGPPNLGEEELEYLLDCIGKLDVVECSLLKKMVSGRHFYSVFATTCLYLKSLDRFVDLDSYMFRHYKYIRYGLILGMIAASTVIVEKISKIFRFDERIVIDGMGSYDLRRKGIKMTDRLYDKDIVTRMLMKGPNLRDMEDMFSTKLSGASKNGRSKYAKMRKRLI